MKNRCACGAIILLLLLVGQQWIDAQEQTAAAQSAAESWLRLVDGQQYASSWQTAAAYFKARVTEERWQALVQGVRNPLGALKSRTVKSTTSAKTLPGAPDGEYVVMEFNTSFEHKAAAVERITMMREFDGNWRTV